MACRLRHDRGGDAEFRVLCAAMEVGFFGEETPSNCELLLHTSEVPCLSCLGAMLQFNYRHPGVLRVSFDRGRECHRDTVVDESTQRLAPPFVEGKSPQDAATPPTVEVYAGGSVQVALTFYTARPVSRPPCVVIAPSSSSGVPQKTVSGQQTFYMSVGPAFFNVDEYDDYDCT